MTQEVEILREAAEVAREIAGGRYPTAEVCRVLGVFGLLGRSFAASGSNGLAPALAVMLGANVGTAALCELFALNTAYIGTPLVLLGVLFFRWLSDGRTTNSCRIAIRLGLMLMASGALVHTLSGIESAPLLKPALNGLSSDPLLATLAAALVTWACHSSIAIVLHVASFAASGVIELPRALALVLGANLGGALPPLLSASTPAARRLPVGNLLVRASGVLLALGFVAPLSELVKHYDSDPGRRVVDFHVLLNVFLALAFLLFVEPFAKLLTKVLPSLSESANPATPMYLDQAGLCSGTVALANASRETLRMADMVAEMLQRLPEVREDRSLTSDGRPSRSSRDAQVFASGVLATRIAPGSRTTNRPLGLEQMHSFSCVSASSLFTAPLFGNMPATALNRPFSGAATQGIKR